MYYVLLIPGDFNCVDQLHRDTLSANGTYANLHNKKWREIAAKRGLIDIYPFLTNDAPGGFTRLTATVHTRIDRIYGPTENTSWRSRLFRRVQVPQVFSSLHLRR